MSHQFTVLHISDLHERGPREKERARHYRVLGAAWQKNIAELQQEGPIDLVCFTGDLADWGQAEEYERVSAQLDALLKQLGLGRERLFLVPGNHDIDRKILRDKPQKSPEQLAFEMLRSNLHKANPLDVSRWLEGGDPPFGFDQAWLDLTLSRQNAYRNFLHTFGLATLLPRKDLHPHLGYRVSLQLPTLPFPVQVVGLDSSWLAGDDADSGRLRLTDGQVMRLCLDAEGGALPGFRLALVHHPLLDLADASQCRALLADSVHLLLRGHMHESELTEWADFDRKLRSMAAGCLYEGDRADQYPNSCSVIRVQCDEAGLPLRYDVRLRSFSARSGHWFDDGGIYRNAPSGRLTIQLGALPLPPPRPTKGVFAGRKEQLAQLAAHLLPLDSSSRPVAVGAISGMPGVGKSYLCDRFFLTNQASFPGGYHKLSVPALPGMAVTKDLLLERLAALVKVQVPVGQRTAALQSALCSPRALLHIENVDTEELADVAAQLVSELEGCTIVLSGRYALLGHGAGWVRVEVRPLSEPDALDQLQQELGGLYRSADKTLYRQLVQKVGYLPLAIHLCAGQLRNGFQVERYLRELERKIMDAKPLPGDPLGSTPEQKERAILRSSIGMSWQALLSALPDAHPAHVAGMGYAPPEGVGIELAAALCALPEDPCETVLVKARLLALIELEEEGASCRYRVHPLIAEFLRQQPQPEAGGRIGLGAWIQQRLSKRDDSQGEARKSLYQEQAALTFWLALVPADEIPAVERAGTYYAITNGPYGAWAQFCERGLQSHGEGQVRSNLLWTLSNVLMSSGQMDAAELRAQEKSSLDRREDRHQEAACAQGKIADIYQARGQLDEALRIRHEDCLPAFQTLGDIHSRAVTLGKIADVYQVRGQLDEALRILKEDCLPAFQTLGDIRSRAVSLGKIADIYQARGQLDEALRIRQEEELPVYLKLGEIRERAVTLGKIADIYHIRGQLDEALRIRQEEELPVYLKLGDISLRAVTLGQIADIYQARGQLDEALRIRQEEELPVYLKLGDIRSRAVTLGKIADIYQVRGQLDEALRIRQEDCLPVYLKLGDISERALTLGRVADIYQARGQLDEALRIRQEDCLPVYLKLGNIRERAVTLGQITDIYKARGQLDEALRILKEDCLPAFQTLGDSRSRAVTLGNIACIHQARGQLDEALRILKEDCLPAFQTLGDIRQRAATLGKIAEIYQTRGQLDEALRTLKEDCLPAFQTLGDSRSRAVTLGNIACIHQARGQLDEALRILKEDCLPAFQTLGDIRSLAATLGKIANIYQDRGQLDEALRIRQEEELPVYLKLGDISSRAVTLGQIADIYQARGQLDEALRIRQEEELPVYLKLGARHNALVCEANIALTLLRRKATGDREQAMILLNKARAEAAQMKLPEAQQIGSILDRLSSATPSPPNHE